MIWLWITAAILFLLFGLVVFRGSPYVPSHKSDIKQALSDLYPLNGNDVLVDIGSGDGVVLREAAAFGARAIGYEINPVLVLTSRFLSRKYKGVNTRLVDFWSTHLPDDITVVYVFSVTRDVEKIAKWVQKEVSRLNRSIYLISYGSKFGNRKTIKSLGAYHLYLFQPLQPQKAQV